MNFFFAAGDAPFFFAEQLKHLTFFPDLWRGQEEFGVSSLPLLWVDYPFRLITFLLSKLGFSWFFIDKFWWGLVFSLAIYGSYQLGKRVGLSKRFSLISNIIYSTNTYILLLFDGGQIGVALAYAFVPLVLSQILDYLSVKKNKRSEVFKTGLLLSILVFLDLRIFYVFCTLLISVIGILYVKKKIVIPKNFLLIPVILLGINLFWILPTVQYKDSLHSFVSETTSSGSELSFFSVADFSHALSLLHPNYPENLFGKVYFLKPEFLILPILAFIIFLWNDYPELSIAFGFVALIGVFLSKGVQEPFGGIYQLLYKIVPGFFLFRDPTKWYVLSAVAYSILIPLSLRKISTISFFKKKQSVLLVIFVLFWIFTLRAVFNGQVSGNIKPLHVTNDYDLLKNTLLADPNSGRTLWLPSIEKFGFASDIHPALSAQTLFNESSISGILTILKKPETPEKIISADVTYVVVPQDIKKRIFLDDYNYTETLRSTLINQINTIQSFKKLTQFKDLAVYKISSGSSFFTINNQPVMASPQAYDQWKLSLPATKKGDSLLVSFSYDPNWRLVVANTSVKPSINSKKMMEFTLPQGENENAALVYLPTSAAKKGATFSLITLGVVIVCLF